MASNIVAECKYREAQKVHGLWIRSSLSAAGTEWENLMHLYSIKSGDQGTRYVIRENTDAKQSCDLFCGGSGEGEGTSEYEIAAGEYVSCIVTPKLGLFWGRAMDDADIYLSKVWPGQNGRKLDDFRMEIRNMTGKKPFVEILYRVLPE